ncbi:Uncharacterised protein [Mycobacteroides abscessus]|nr:Uncharacterised protein [Mycobacteroides abscessus]
MAWRSRISCSRVSRAAMTPGCGARSCTAAAVVTTPRTTARATSATVPARPRCGVCPAARRAAAAA